MSRVLWILSLGLSCLYMVPCVSELLFLWSMGLTFRGLYSLNLQFHVGEFLKFQECLTYVCGGPGPVVHGSKLEPCVWELRTSLECGIRVWCLR